MVLTSSHYNWFIAVITQKQTGGEETEKDVFINISLILAQLWTFGMSFIKLYVTLSGKFKTILETVKVFTEDWSLIDRANMGKILSLESDAKKR